MGVDMDISMGMGYGLASCQLDALIRGSVSVSLSASVEKCVKGGGKGKTRE